MTAKYSQILVGDRRDRNIDDLHLVLAHQVEEQVQRPAEDIQIDAEIHYLLLMPAKGRLSGRGLAVRF